MGPPSMNGGRGGMFPSYGRAYRCFNGAAVDERRKGVRQVRGAIRVPRRFNGAAVDERRKASRETVIRDVLGALQWGRRR